MSELACQQVVKSDENSMRWSEILAILIIWPIVWPLKWKYVFGRVKRKNYFCGIIIQSLGI